MIRNLFFNLGLVVLTVAMALTLQAVMGPSQVSAAKDEVCICHAAGLAGTTSSSRCVPTGPPSTARRVTSTRTARREQVTTQDYLGPCNTPSPSPSPAPSPSPGL